MVGLYAMKKQILVEKSEFDAALSKMLKTKPIPMKQTKTRGKRVKRAPSPSSGS